MSKGQIIFMLVMVALVVAAIGRFRPPGYVDGH